MPAISKRMWMTTLGAVLLCFALQDYDSAFVVFTAPQGKPYAWSSATPVIRWSVDPSAPPILRESMLYSLKIWSDATSNALKFEEGPGGIFVAWDSTGDKIIDSIFLAYTTFTADSNFNINSGRITVNAYNYTWQRGGYGGVGPISSGKRDANLDSVLLHELGHALGLDHSDKNSSALVGTASAGDYPTMNSIIYDGAQTLHIDDETGIRSIYNTGSPPAAVLPVTATPTSGPRNVVISFSNADGAEDTEWDFGDGGSASGASVQHKFTALGTYTVTAKSNGMTAQLTVEVQKNIKRQKVRRPKRIGKSQMSYNSAGFGPG